MKQFNVELVLVRADGERIVERMNLFTAGAIMERMGELLGQITGPEDWPQGDLIVEVPEELVPVETLTKNEQVKLDNEIKELENVLPKELLATAKDATREVILLTTPENIEKLQRQAGSLHQQTSVLEQNQFEPKGNLTVTEKIREP